MATFLDLFAGIGGFRHGLERSGHKGVGHVEIDKYANQSYTAMYGLIPCKFGDNNKNCCHLCGAEVNKNCDGKTCKGEWYAKDIKKLGAGEIPNAEIWTFGFPCTDISISNSKQLGLDGGRSGLFFEVARLLQGKSAEDRPQWLIVENVKNLLSIKRGGDFTAVLFELSELGYDLEWGIVNSKNFHVPQNRERVYVVGHLRERGGGKVFPIGGANPAPIKQIVDGSQGNRIYDPSGVAVTMVAQAGGFGGRTGLYSIPSFVDMNEDTCFTEIARCVRARQDAGITNHRGEASGVIVESKNTQPCAAFIDMNEGAAITETARCIKARQYAGVSNHKGETSGIFLCHGNPDCVRAVITPNRENKRQNGRRFKEVGEPSFTVTCQDLNGIMLCCCEGWKEGLHIREAKKDGYTVAHHGDGINLAYPNSTVSRGRVGKQCAQTIVTGGSMGVLLCCRIRRLTPREAWRLQAFDDYLFDRAKAAGLSDAQLYKQAGNAVTVSVVYEIGKRLAEIGGGA